MDSAANEDDQPQTSTDQLFLIEVLVDKVTLEESVGKLPNKRDIVVTIQFGGLVNLELKFDGLAPTYPYPKGNIYTF